ncbi:MAG: ATP-binding cassette domain-containing protein [Candidatus Eisenbacteria bacterium]|nr:ATP-binding cassette domain-containing protein [Candidatus Eisenbacteria bacterium]
MGWAFSIAMHPCTPPPGAAAKTMPTISFENVGFHYTDPYAAVFTAVSLTLDTTWKTGLVGRNGTGKTTLLRLLRGDLVPARGRLHVPVAVGRFPSEPRSGAQPLRRLIKDCVAPFARWEREMQRCLATGDPASLKRYAELLELYQRHDGYRIDARIEQELAELGFEEAALDRDFDTLSGGEQTRALIAALFLRPDLFPLIDEPTNHLDLAGRMLLADYLNSKSGFLLVSHDRHVLEASTDHILSIHKESLRLHHAGFADWELQAVREELHESRRRTNLKREIRSLERSARRRRGWSTSKEKEKRGAYDKGRIGHMAAKQMRRARSIERRISAMVEEKRRLMRKVDKERRLKLEADGSGPQRLLAVEDVALDIAGRRIVDDVTLHVDRGDRLALIGPNGCGKTTLLRAIAGDLHCTAGIIHMPRHIQTVRAYQTPLWREGSLRAALRSLGADEARFRAIMDACGVSGHVFDRPLETFSQGELKKVDLCRSFLDPQQLLIWDEPLNYIDIPSRKEIERVILDTEPTLLFVEHDRRFIETAATRILQLPGRSQP